MYSLPAPSLSQLDSEQTVIKSNEVQFQYLPQSLNSIGILKKTVDKMSLVRHRVSKKPNHSYKYYTKLLKFCCSGHWDINHPTINSPFGDSFWHRLGLMQDQHVRVAYCKTWFAHQLGCLIYLGRDSYGPDHLIFEPYTCSKIIRPATKCARAYTCDLNFFNFY